MCYGYIKDTILDPLPHDHIMRDYINMASLERSIDEIVPVFMRALRAFGYNKFFFIKPRKDKPENSTDFTRDEWVWSEFQIIYPSQASEIKDMIITCAVNGVGRKTCLKIQLLTHFFMMKLRFFLINVPELHAEHIAKEIPIPSESLGPVPYQELCLIKLKAGLPLPNWEEYFDT